MNFEDQNQSMPRAAELTPSKPQSTSSEHTQLRSNQRLAYVPPRGESTPFDLELDLRDLESPPADLGSTSNLLVQSKSEQTVSDAPLSPEFDFGQPVEVSDTDEDGKQKDLRPLLKKSHLLNRLCIDLITEYEEAERDPGRKKEIKEAGRKFNLLREEVIEALKEH